MPDKEAHVTEDRFLRFTAIAILGVLVLVAFLLFSLDRQLRRSTDGTERTEGTEPLTAAKTTSEPEIAIPEIPKKPIVTVQQRISKPTSPNSNYIRDRQESSVINPQSAPAPSAFATPPLDPAPFAAPAVQALSTPPLVGPSVVPPEPTSIDATVHAGTFLSVRLQDTVGSDRNRAGDRFTAVLDESLYSGNLMVAPRGSTVEGRIIQVEQAGRVQGLSEIRLELDRLMLSTGNWVEIVTDSIVEHGESTRGQDAARIGTGAAIGAAIGAIAGGRKGAGIGAATAAGASAAGVLLTRGKPVILARETRLSFQLRAPVTVSLPPDSIRSSTEISPLPQRDFSDRRWAPRRRLMSRR
ncbi:MAG: hypothetical protein A3F68_02390 [Acidobacteria bacterium RIFCSPLOWO2_12_FULL_54_10]|nr:MAG: hypothetical protein A3F68_02390 [Acidobacteria bacterium RIFCSPLOWO2_12_FULL_54_10]